MEDSSENKVNNVLLLSIKSDTMRKILDYFRKGEWMPKSTIIMLLFLKFFRSPGFCRQTRNIFLKISASGDMMNGDME